jgi:hypothetical protein
MGSADQSGLESLQKYVDEQSAKLGIAHRNVKIIRGDGKKISDCSAFHCRSFHANPLIVLPSFSTPEESDPDRLRVIINHEMTHLANQDWILQEAGRVGLATAFQSMMLFSKAPRLLRALSSIGYLGFLLGGFIPENWCAIPIGPLSRFCERNADAGAAQLSSWEQLFITGFHFLADSKGVSSKESRPSIFRAARDFFCRTHPCHSERAEFFLNAAKQKAAEAGKTLPAIEILNMDTPSGQRCLYYTHMKEQKKMYGVIIDPPST